jgi:hypothetical protein
MQIILAQMECDQPIQSLLKKFGEVHDLMSQKNTLGQISSRRSIAGWIDQQTLECAHFIRDYSKKRAFVSHRVIALHIW